MYLLVLSTLYTAQSLLCTICIIYIYTIYTIYILYIGVTSTYLILIQYYDTHSTFVDCRPYTTILILVF